MELNEQLYSKNIEMDTVIKKYVGMVESRDQEIRSLQVQLKVFLETIEKFPYLYLFFFVYIYIFY